MEVQQASGTRILELDTVRALHQTVVSLRAALEASKTELHHLRHKYETHTDQSLYTDALQKLTSENQLLREKITSSQEFKIEDNHAVKQTVNDPLAESVKKVKFNLNTEPFRERLEDTINVEQNVDGSEESDSICESPQVTKQETEVHFKVQTEPPKLDVETTPDTLDVFLSEGIVIKNSDNITIVTDNNFEKLTKESEQFKEVFIKHSEENIENELDGAFETRIELESRFDLTIKVSASKTGEFQPIRVETSDDSFITFSKDNNQFRNNSNSRHKFDEDTKITVTSSENVNIINDTLHIVEEQTTIVSEDHFEMAGSRDADSVNPISDKFNVQVKIISEEDLVTDSSPKRVCNSDHLTMETDDLSIRSISEGDNSVFSENVVGGGGGGGMGSGGRRVCEQDSISGNDSEEVDDIELIFTNDDTKELTGFQEDLVSITEGDAWTGGRSDASTPVLLRFNVLDPEGQMQDRSGNTASTDNFENENQENFIHQGVMADSDMHTRKGILRKGNGNDLNENAGEIFDDVDDLPQGRRPYLRSSSTKNYLEAQESRHQNRKSFESNESCSFDNQKSYSFDHTPQNSSFERGSSMDAETRELSFDQRDESLDQFDVSKSTMRTQYSVYVETDISKCGVMEDDGFSGNLNVRRNTCPNPFQYRPLPHREVVRGAAGGGGAAGGARPLLALPGPRAPRRSSAAQTHISALPGHWRSDTQLARKILPSALTTLPAKVHMESFPSRLVSSGAAQTTRRSEESRRVLLSDIGFTSMVPELSRSAEPVWAGLQPLPPGPPPRPLCCAQHAAQCFGSVPSSPTRTDSQSTNSRYWSKGSMQRSVSGRMGDTIIPGSNRVGFYAEQPLKWRGSLPELRAPTCPHGGHGGHGARLAYRLPRAGDSEDSTEELLDEAERFLRSSIDCLSVGRAPDDEFCPSNYSRPYLPSGPRQLRLGHLVKVIAPHGKIALGKVRYVGVAGGPTGPGGATPTYVGLQLGPGASGGGDGSFRGRRYFHCEKGRSVFVPFSKVVMAWADC